MQLTKTVFQNSAIFIEKKWVENQLWGKTEILWGKRINSLVQSGNDADGTAAEPEDAGVLTAGVQT